MELKLSDFDYALPKERIAQVPLPRRDSSRLLILHRDTGAIEHRRFGDILDTLQPEDALVLNDTKVKPARIFGRRTTGGKVEALLLRSLSPRTYEALLNPSSTLKVGSRLLFGEGVEAEVVGGNGVVKKIRFEKGTTEFWIRQKGLIPLPPYIRRLPNREDLYRYQTVYAEREGAVAAPTAGLHFTKPLLRRIEGSGIRICHATLHVGYGTFEPVREEEISRHRMHEEHFEISRRSCQILNGAREKGGRIIAVGTTSCRVLETSIHPQSPVEASRLLPFVATHAKPQRGLAALGSSAEPGAKSASLGRSSPVPFWYRASVLRGQRGEALSDNFGRVDTFHPMKGWTDLFIYPPYEFRGTDALLTNFHLPKSTLLMLVSAFAGMEPIRRAYREAIEQGYRFYSYGDAMLIL